MKKKCICCNETVTIQKLCKGCMSTKTDILMKNIIEDFQMSVERSFDIKLKKE